MADMLTDPTGYAANVFEKNIGGKLADVSKLLLSEFSVHCERSDASSQIPSLNRGVLGDVYPKCMVRFRGMIQDMHGTELFLSSVSADSLAEKESSLSICGFLRDTLDCPPGYKLDLDAMENKTASREVFTVVAVPGETEWFGSVSDGLLLPPPIIAASVDPYTAMTTCTKRSIDDCLNGGGGELSAAAMEVDSSEGNPSKHRKTAESTEMHQNGSNALPASSTNNALKLSLLADKMAHLPLSTDAATPVFLAKFYGQEAESIKLNEVYELFGVLSNDIIEEREATADDDEQLLPSPPPSSLIPKLHVVHFRKLESPFIGSVDFAVIGKSLLSVLTKLFAGDELAAQYFLCFLVSKVSVRSDEIPVGCLPLNLTKVPTGAETTETLATCLSLLCDKVDVLPLTVDVLNSKPFSPIKDYTNERLTAGRLQLADGTVLLIDETVMQTGQLTEIGVRNIAALRSVIAGQKLAYDFKFHVADFNTDVNVIVLSEGKSLLQTPALRQLPLQSALDATALSDLKNDPMLNDYRHLVLAVRALMERVTIPEDVRSTIADDFVELRKMDQAVDAFRLHDMITVGRILTALDGQMEMTLPQWMSAKDLEQRRRSRMTQ